MKPILFSGPMVRAILSGNKTQTRRVVKDQPTSVAIYNGEWCAMEYNTAQPGMLGPERVIKCPYGQPGDRLWVRETWKTDKRLDSTAPSGFSKWPVKYLADFAVEACGGFSANTDGKTRASIHMPRWASRITLEIVSVRVERLNEISGADIWAEGMNEEEYEKAPGDLSWYRNLWESINGPGSWAKNPYVWVIEFKRVTE